MRRAQTQEVNSHGLYMTDILSFVEQAVTHSEETWDALASSDIATVIPVAKDFVKVWRGFHDLSAALFAA